MMGDLALNPVTVALLLVIVACAILAVRRMLHRGMCDCGDHCDGCSGCVARHASGSVVGITGGAGSRADNSGTPPCCAAAEEMLARAEQAAAKRST